MGGEGFDVWLMAFAPQGQDPAYVLADAFGIERRRARRLVESLPKVVKRGVSNASAQQYASALRKLGGKVEIRQSQRTDAYPPAALPKISAAGSTAAPPGPGSAGGSAVGAGTPRNTLGDGPEGTRPAAVGRIVSGGNAPYAWLTYSLMGWLMMLGGGAILALELWLRANPFVQVVGLPELLITWIGGALTTTGLIEGVYGVVKRRRLTAARLPVGLVWLAALVGLQALHGNPLLG